MSIDPSKINADPTTDLKRVTPWIRIRDGSITNGRFALNPGDLATLPGLHQAEVDKPDEYVWRTSPGFNEGSDQAVPPGQRVIPYPVPAPMPQGERFDQSSTFVELVTLNNSFDTHHDLSFHAHSVLVDNYSDQWIFVVSARRWVPPATVGVVLPLAAATGIAHLRQEAPRGYIQSTAGLGGFNTVMNVSHTWFAAMLPPCPGIPIPAANQATGPLLTSSASSTGAAAAITASLPALSPRNTYLTGFEVTGAGATAASVIVVTVTGAQGGTLSYDVVVPAGATTSIVPLVVTFAPYLLATGGTGTITVNVPSFGAGNTNEAVTIHGFYQ